MHRDIAVRNILIGEHNTVKIGDFGMARVIPIGEHSWKMKQPAKLPIRYLAPEAESLRVFSEASDVWSFGVVQWEIMAYAETPYDVDGIEISQVRRFITDGGRPKLPSVRDCTPLLVMLMPQQFERSVEDKNGNAMLVWKAWYDVIRACMEGSPYERPPFAVLNTSLGTLFEEQSADLPALRDVGSMMHKIATVRAHSPSTCLTGAGRQAPQQQQVLPDELPQRGHRRRGRACKGGVLSGGAD